MIAVFACLSVAPLKAQTPAIPPVASIQSVLAHIPDAVFHVVTVATDTAEYVTGKVAAGTASVDVYADDAVNYFHGIASGSTAQIKADRAARKAAKKAQKKAAKVSRQNNAR